MSVFHRSYYEANDVTSAIEIIEEAFTKHQSLVSMEDVNIAAELYISSKQYDKALAVWRIKCISILCSALLCQSGWTVDVPVVLKYGHVSTVIELIRYRLFCVSSVVISIEANGLI